MKLAHDLLAKEEAAPLGNFNPHSSPLDGDITKASQITNCYKIQCGPKISAKSLQTQFMIMEGAVIKSPSVNITIMGKLMPPLTDSRNVISLMCIFNFNHYFKLRL